MAYVASPIAKANAPYGDVYHKHVPVLVTTGAEYGEKRCSTFVSLQYGHFTGSESRSVRPRSERQTSDRNPDSNICMRAESSLRMQCEQHAASLVGRCVMWLPSRRTQALLAAQLSHRMKTCLIMRR
jgi:hypothetical protein